MGESAKQLYLFRSQCGSAGGNGIADTELVHGHGIELTFDYIRTIIPCNGSTCLVQTEKVSAFLEQRRVPGIDVLAGVFLRGQPASGISVYVALDIKIGKHDAVLESVEGEVLLASLQDVRFKQLLFGKSGCKHLLFSQVTCRGISNSEILQDFVIQAEPSVMQIKLRFRKMLLEKECGAFHRYTLRFTFFYPGRFLVGHHPFRKRDSRTASQPGDSLVE